MTPALRPLLAAAAAVLLSTGCAAWLARGEQVRVVGLAVPRPTGGKVEALLLEPDPVGRYPVVFYLNGSSCASNTEGLGYLQAIARQGYGVVAPEKRGVNPGDDGRACSEEFLRTNDRLQRLGDSQLLLAQLASLLPRWDGRLIVMGTSEGGALAPELAVTAPQAVAVVVLAAGGWSQAQELLGLERRRLLAAGERPDEGHPAMLALKRQFDAIRREPIAERTWLGRANTYKRWASFLDDEPLAAFVRLDVPIFLAMGTEDASVPVESADAVAQAFERAGKRNLAFQRYAGLDHDFKDAAGTLQIERVARDLFAWLRRHVPLAAPTR